MGAKPHERLMASTEKEDLAKFNLLEAEAVLRDLRALPKANLPPGAARRMKADMERIRRGLLEMRACVLDECRAARAIHWGAFPRKLIVRVFIEEGRAVVRIGPDRTPLEARTIARTVRERPETTLGAIDEAIRQLDVAIFEICRLARRPSLGRAMRTMIVDRFPWLMAS